MALRSIWQFTDWAVQARMIYGTDIYRSCLDSTVRKLPYCPKVHVSFVILYRIYGLKTAAAYLQQQIISLTKTKLNIKVLKSKPFKNDLIDQYSCLRVKKLLHLLYEVCFTYLPM